MCEQDPDEGRRTRHEIIRDEHVVESNVRAREHEIIHGEVPDETKKLKQDDGVTDQCMNQSRTTEDDSERVACQLKVEEKVQTTWLSDTGADAHVMPKYVWEQLGEPTLQTTRVTLRGANGSDLGAIGEVLVRNFSGQRKFSSQLWVSMTRENVEGEMTADERITHERTGHATYDPSCETCLKVRGVTTHPRKAVAEAAYFDCATV